MTAISGLFYGSIKMATDVNVQYFSHLNGLVLGNNWGDMVRLLDTCLVNGLPLSSVTSASVDTQGDITLNLYADHKSLLFQIVELSGFEPVEINGKYRIKGAPNSTKLILKALHIEKQITKLGTAKLASLGYEMIFRDAGDVRRVYRAKNPSNEHPFIRVDETISDGANSYVSTYAKSAMVGLLENMTHIDDYRDVSKLQLPLDTSDLSKNWKLSGSGASCVRGWSRWYWSKNWGNTSDAQIPSSGSRSFTLCGNKDSFYLLRSIDTSVQNFKTLLGCGVYESSLDNSIIPNWFLISKTIENKAEDYFFYNDMPDGNPLMRADSFSKFYIPTYDVVNRLQAHTTANGIVPDQFSGYTGLFSSNNLSAMQIPIFDANKYLRGNLNHILYAGNNKNLNPITTPLFSDNSMYVWDSAYTFYGGDVTGGFYFYLGEIE